MHICVTLKDGVSTNIWSMSSKDRQGRQLVTRATSTVVTPLPPIIPWGGPSRNPAAPSISDLKFNECFGQRGWTSISFMSVWHWDWIWQFWKYSLFFGFWCYPTSITLRIPLPGRIIPESCCVMVSEYCNSHSTIWTNLDWAQTQRLCNGVQIL